MAGSTEGTYLPLTKQVVGGGAGLPEPYRVSNITFRLTESGLCQFTCEIDAADAAYRMAGLGAEAGLGHPRPAG